MKNILVIRRDKIGDTLLTLPALLQLRNYFPDCEITFLCAPVLVHLIEDFLAIYKIKTIAKLNPNDLKTFQAAIVLWEKEGLSRKLFFNKVPLRFGLFSKLESFLFLNYGTRQKRSLGEKSEAEYNLDIVDTVAKYFKKNILPRDFKITLPGSKKESESIHKKLQGLNLSEKTFAVFHPGQAGSALNFSASKYCEMISDFKKNMPVVLTQGPHKIDGEMIYQIERELGTQTIFNNLSLIELKELYRLAKIVVAPSTGTLHLAHLVGATTIGIFPPILHQNAKRWGPYGGSGKSHILQPAHSCPGGQKCLGNACEYYYCMDKLSHNGSSISQ